MPMGYGANFAIETKLEDLKKMNMKLFQDFLDELDKQEMVLDEFAQLLKIEDASETKGFDSVNALFTKFQKVFNNMFGVVITLDYHDKSEEGDTYDDVDGAFFTLDFNDVYQLTEDADRLSKQLPFEISQFVTYG